MSSLKIESTAFTPEINFDIDNNTLTFLKVSKPANAFEFYKPVFEFIDNFEKEKLKSKDINELILDFNFDYFNTSTAKVIYNLLERLKELQKRNVKVIINWYYYSEDDDLLEEGEMMSESLRIPFNFVPIIDKG